MRAFLNRAADRCAPHEQRLGKATLVFSLIIGLVGFPAQIYKNWAEQESGVSLIIIGAAILMYLARIPYLTGKRAWWLLPTEIIGLIATLILLWQWFIYA